MKIIHPDGKVTYRKKRKIGGHKKPWHKEFRERKIRERNEAFLDRFGWGHELRWKFKICLFSNKKEVKCIGRFRTLEEAEAKRKLLEIENDSVVFASEFTNTGKKVSSTLTDVDTEYALMKKVTEDWETNNTEVRDEYGRAVPVSCSNDKWMILDLFPCVLEETFWVYGYDSSKGRKTYSWICENLIDAKECTLRILVYGNKVLIIDDDYEFDFVICKNIADAVRMYRMMYDRYTVKDTLIFFTGVVETNARKRECADMIQKKTGWTLKKIQRNSTRG